jgi:peptidyl-dipeptidase A
MTIVFALASITLMAACQQTEAPPPEASGPTAEDAVSFVAEAESRLETLLKELNPIAWAYQTNITPETEAASAAADEKLTQLQVELASKATGYLDLELDSDTRRKLNLLRSGIVIPAPMDPEKNAEQAEIGTRLNSMYATGKYCREDDDCRDLQQLNDVMNQSRDEAELLDAWVGWRQVSPAMRPLYERQTELANEAAADLGFGNLGEMWRSLYDMDADEFPVEVDRLWGQVEPLYTALHCHVRAKLGEVYGTDIVPPNGAIPAHLLGNMWAQEWANIYDLVAPEGSVSNVNLTQLLNDADYDYMDMVKTGENFFSSLGFAPLPDTFYERSLFLQPEDREVLCHASAWDLDGQDDIRIKMCIKENAEDFRTIHHELGHNYYQRAYKGQSPLYRDSANDGFHEAVGDTVSLSITPEYLNSIGLLDDVPDASGDLGLLLQQALDKVAFLPFGLLVDKWRWNVFAGDVGPDQYNELWWQLRENYQGVKSPVERGADAFDPGAKFHVPGNYPYSRYFLAHILQFQFHRSLCEISGNEGPIHRCSIYGSKEAGARLNAMLEMGVSQPWQDALETMTGSRDMDATAILDYFAPLKTWLDEQNADRQCGW